MDWSVFEDGAAGHISRRLVELAGVVPGDLVLDVAAGNGEPALTAARLTGPAGRVFATDISGTPGPLSRPTPEAIGGLLEGGGFTDVVVERQAVVYAYDSPEHFTTHVRAIAAPIRAMIERNATDGNEQEAAWDAITDAAAEAGGGSGPLSLSNVVLIASASAQA